MRRFSLSTLGHARICPGSVVLTGFDSLAGSAGSAIHEGACWRNRYGNNEMLEALPVICERWHLSEVETAIVTGRLRSWTPTIPEGTLSELPHGLFDDGSVRVVRGGRGTYERVPGLILAGTIDLAWSEPDPLEVEWCSDCGGSGRVEVGELVTEFGVVQQFVDCDCDGQPIAARCPPGSIAHVAEIKSGVEANVPRILQNWQHKGAALLFARWTGAENVAPHTCFVGPGEGKWDSAEVAFDRADLDDIEAEIRRVAAVADEQQERLESGAPLKLVTGPHCTYCKARPGCPAQLAEVRNLVQLGPRDLRPGKLTADEARALAGMLSRAEAVTRQVRKALQAHSDAFGPIALDDGRQWGMHDTGKHNTIFDPLETYNALCAEPTVGRAFAARALLATRKSVKAAIQEAHEANGLRRKVAPVERAVYSEVARNAGIAKRPKLCYGPHHPDQAVRALHGAVEEGDDDDDI